MPRDRLSLAVRVRREIYLVRLFAGTAQCGKDIPLSSYRNILRFIIMLDIDTQAALWQIPYMAV